MVISPIAFSLFGLDIYWYGITYAISFLFAYFFIIYFAKDFGFKSELIEDIFFYVMIFSVLGGRLFEVLFYNPVFYFNNPIQIIAVQNGGMSIHGGIFGAFVTLYYFSKKHKINILKLTDLFILPAGIGLAFGRLANFVNQELVGKVTTSNLGVIFPNYDNSLRYPYVIFEGFKNLIVFEILFYLYIFKKLKTGSLTALFLILFGIGRFLLDFFKESEYLIFNLINIGQLFSLIIIICGIYIFFKINKQ